MQCNAIWRHIFVKKALLFRTLHIKMYIKK